MATRKKRGDMSSGQTRKSGERRVSHEKIPSLALREIFSSNPTAVAVTDVSTNQILEVNTAFERLTGYSREELVGTTIEELQMWENPELRAQYLESILTHRAVEGFEARLRRKDGSIRNVVLDGSMVRHPGGRTLIASFIRDVTDRVFLQEALRQSEERYRRITNAVTDYIYTVHIKDGEVIRTVHSPACEAVTGYTPEEFEQDPYLWFTMVEEEDRESVREHFNRVCSGERVQPIEHRIRRKDGQVRWVSNMPVIHRDPSGAITGYDGVISDITERKKAELDLKESEERFRALSEASFGGIGIHDKGKILDCNKGLSDITGYSREELIGMDGLTLIAPPWRDLVMEKIVSGYSKAYDVEGLRKDGTVYPLEIRGRNIPYHGRTVRVTEFRDITERRRSEEILRASEERFRLMAELTGRLVYDLDVSTGSHTFHGAVTEITQYTPEEITSIDMNTWVEMIHREDRPIFVGAFEKAMAEGVPLRVEYRIRRKDGSFIYVEDHGVFIRDSSGRPVRMLGSIGDITERKCAELTLRENEELYRSIFHNLHAVMLLIDPTTGDIVDANPAASAYYGYTHEELTSKKITDINTLSPKEIYAEMERARGMKKNIFQFRHRLSSGHVRDVEVFSGPIKVSGRTLLFSIIHDVTDRRLAEENLRRSEERLGSILKNVADIILILDGNGRVTYATPSLYRILGYTEDRIIGASPLDLVHPDDREMVARELAGVYEGTNDGLPTEFRALKADGQWLYIEAIGSMLVREPGIEGVIITARDITERKRAQEKAIEMERRVLHAQRLESLGLMAGGIAHDFNNLLMAVIGNLDMAQMDISKTSRAYTFVNNAIKASRRAAELTNQMLAFSGKGRFDLRLIDLGELVADMENLMRASLNKNATLIMQSAPGLPPVQADAEQIRQVVMNLVTNASEALGDKTGHVTVTTGVVHCSPEDLAKSSLAIKPPAGDYVMLEVADTGIGMDEETLERIFDPFFSTKFTGRGLGMAAVSGIVTGHNGAIMIDSTPHQGTKVRVLLPVHREPGKVQAETKEQGLSKDADSSVPPSLVLVIEKDDLVRSTCEAMLERLGFTMLAASEPKEALAIYEREKERITCVLLDFTRPELGGIQTLNSLSAKAPPPKIILLIGFENEAAVRRLAGNRISGIIKKPFSIDHLRNALTEALGKS